MNSEIKEALEEKLLAMGDDELILGHRDSEWTGHAPILEEDIAFANIAQDELGHAKMWYEALGALNDVTRDQLIFFRPAAAFRNARLLELPRGDWAFSMLRQYLFDSFELVRARHLVQSSYRPLLEVAARVDQEEQYHHRHSEAWVRRLGLGTEESNRRMKTALEALWPETTQLFQPLAGEGLLVEEGIVPPPAPLREEWLALVRPLLETSGLALPEAVAQEAASREIHTPHLAELLAEMQQVARLDPSAEW